VKEMEALTIDVNGTKSIGRVVELVQDRVQ
jgi:hypothetical protein